MTVGLVLTVVALAIAGRRLWWLWRLAKSGQPAPERVAAVREHPGRDLETQAAEVIGQRKLLKWSVPGVAHALTFWGFIVLLLTIIEAYGALFSRTFAIPGIGHWAFIGFIENLFAVAVLAAIITFTVIRVRNSPERRGRASRFLGSHTKAAWLVLEGAAGPGHLHRVRVVPVPVPGLGHRQAAVPQAGHSRPARPRLRQGPVPAGFVR